MPTGQVVQNRVRNVLVISGKAEGSIGQQGMWENRCSLYVFSYSFCKTKVRGNLHIQ